MPFDRNHKIYEALRYRIVSGQFPRRADLKPAGLASDLSASVVPVREALFRLCERGLVEYRANYGFTVSSFDVPEQIRILAVIEAMYDIALSNITKHPEYFMNVAWYSEIVESRIAEGRWNIIDQQETILDFNRIFFPQPLRNFINKATDLGHEARRTSGNQGGVHLGESLLWGMDALQRGNEDDLRQVLKVQLQQRQQSMLTGLGATGIVVDPRA